MQVSTQEAVQIIRRIADLIENRDSFEGNLEWEIVDSEIIELNGVYRCGNSDGQGSLVIIKPSEINETV